MVSKQSKIEHQHHKMTHTPIPRLVTSMAIPTVISMLITIVYNTADTYFVAQLNKSASAAVGAVYAIMAIIQAFGYGIGVGAGSLISRKLGAKEEQKANMYASSGLFASVFAGTCIMTGGLLCLDSFLKLLGCSDTMMPYAIPYAKYILISAPINCATFVLNNTLRSQGKTKLSMIGMGAGGILNIILDPIFIFKLGLGTGGAALATMAGQTFSFAILSCCFISGSSIVKIGVKYVSRNINDYKLIITTGIPTICRQSLGSVAAAVLNIQAIAYGGDAAVAAITIANKVYILVRNLILGIGQGFQPVAGYNYGAGNKKRTWQSFTFTVKTGTVVCSAFSVLTLVFAQQIMLWFTQDMQVVQIGTQTLRIASAAMPLLAFSTYVNHLYQSLGFRFQATFLASCRQGIFFLPAVMLLPLKFGCVGVQASQAVADMATFVISIPFIIYFYRQNIRDYKK